MTDAGQAGALAAGWVVAKSVTVTPKDAQPGETIHIRAIFENENWIPAYAVLQVKLDGAVINTYCSLLSCSVVFGSSEVLPWEFDYTLPTSISPGITHKIEALEQDQIIPAYVDFTVTNPAAPGERNISFSSIPAGAQIYISEGYRGNTPITIPLPVGTYAVRAIYSDKELSRNIPVVSGSGTMPVEFIFTQAPPFDLTKWVENNKWYIGGSIAALGLIWLAVKQPETVKKGYNIAREQVGKGYEQAKRTYRELRE